MSPVVTTATLSHSVTLSVSSVGGYHSTARITPHTPIRHSVPKLSLAMSEPSLPEPSLLRRVAAVVKRIMGAPDYDRYVLHMTKNHPECVLLDRDAFVRERLNDRYSRPGSRCC